ncbi:MAG: CopD family protein [Spirochaetia bacterium]|nr:CopD family protein [Spirochaetia bacterium]
MFTEYYLHLKALHIIFMVTWFAGLFYIVRLFIYMVEASEKKEPDKSILGKQLLLMARRLWYIITWPGMVLTTIFGILLIFANPDVMLGGWFHAKLTLIVLLILYHLSIERMIKKVSNPKFNISQNMSSQKLRMYNEVPTILLFTIVFIVVLKNTISLFFAITGVIGLGVLLMLGIKLYKKYRK